MSPVYESCSTKEGSTMKKIALSLGLRNDLFLLYYSLHISSFNIAFTFFCLTAKE